MSLIVAHNTSQLDIMFTDLNEIIFSVLESKIQSKYNYIYSS